jgi:hypothetical protein
MSQAGKFISSSPAPGTVLTLTGNSGGAVGPDGGGNIDVVGSGTVSVAGNPGTNTLTISVSGSVPDTFHTDSGDATPAAGIINIEGDSAAITTSGSGNTVIVHFNPFIRNVNTTPYTVVTIDLFLAVDASGGPITIRMPNTTTTGRIFVVKDSNGQANLNNIIITTPGGVALFDGFTSYTLNAQYQSVNLIFDGTNYQLW